MNLFLSQTQQFSSKRFPDPGEGSQGTRRAPGGQHKGILASPTNNLSSLRAQLECLCLTHTHTQRPTMGNKKKPLEVCICLDGCDLWASQSCGGMASVTGGLEWKTSSPLGRTGRDRRRGDAFYISDQLEYTELHLGMEEELSEHSWVRIQGRAGTVTL